MQKLSLAVLLASACLALSPAANAEYTGPAADKTTSTVSEAKAMPDNSAVILQGTLATASGDEMYIFTDGTGSINVEIDDGDLEGLNIGPNDVVMIEGEIDRTGNAVEIDVDEIVLAK